MVSFVIAECSCSDSNDHERKPIVLRRWTWVVLGFGPSGSELFHTLRLKPKWCFNSGKRLETDIIVGV